MNAPWITREEFGLNLFEAIKLQASQLQALKLDQIYHRKDMGARAQQYESKAATLSTQLQAIMEKGTIAPYDIRRILAQGGKVT